MLEVRNLRKAYGDIVAVEDVSFSVGDGEVFGLLGPNGAGKSTTMMMACGLLTPDAGTILIDGQEMRPDRRELKRLLGVVPQDLAIYPELTARENLRFFGKLYGLNGSRLTARIDDALERTGLAPRADGAAHTFSGGMKRRLNFGCALLHEPKLLILDEPTVGVDPQSRSHLLDSVQQLSREGVAVIYASHYMEEVEEVCRRVAIVDHGRVVAEDTLDALLGRLKSVIRLRVRGQNVAVPQRFASIATVEQDGDDEHQLIDIDRGKIDSGTSLDETLATLLTEARNQGATLETVESHEPNLERLFLELTGNRLRD
ncbi:MAG: ABC transporter ATP-binding protein [Planctomycetaceae bacterium]|nr:ABC transporter ATP-binding protein [Planctomycetaceae bacterium]